MTCPNSGSSSRAFRATSRGRLPGLISGRPLSTSHDRSIASSTSPNTAAICRGDGLGPSTTRLHVIVKSSSGIIRGWSRWATAAPLRPADRTARARTAFESRSPWSQPGGASRSRRRSKYQNGDTVSFSLGCDSFAAEHSAHDQIQLPHDARYAVDRFHRGELVCGGRPRCDALRLLFIRVKQHSVEPVI